MCLLSIEAILLSFVKTFSQVLSYWDTHYKPQHKFVPKNDGDDLVARQMKRARAEIKDEFRSYLSAPAADVVVVKDVLLCWKVSYPEFKAFSTTFSLL